MYRSEEIRRKLRKAGVGKRPVIWVVHSMGGKVFVKIKDLTFSQSHSLTLFRENLNGLKMMRTIPMTCRKQEKISIQFEEKSCQSQRVFFRPVAGVAIMEILHSKTRSKYSTFRLKEK